MRRGQVPLVLARMGSSPLVLLSLLVTVCMAASLAAALASFATRVLPLAARAELAAAPSRKIMISGTADAAQAAAASRAIRQALRVAFGPRPVPLVTALWSNPVDLPGAQSALLTRVADIAAPEHIATHALLTQGRWPGPPGRMIPAAVPAAVARQLGLAPGSTLTVRDSETRTPVRIRVTGLYRPRQPGSRYWRFDLIDPSSGVTAVPGFVTYGPFIVSRASFGQDGLAVGQASWVAAPAAAALARGDLRHQAAAARRLEGRLQRAGPGGLQVASGLPQLLDGLAGSLAAARFVLLAAALQLLLVVTAALSVAARMLASQREAEIALLSARGVTRGQVTGLALAEALLVSTVAVAAGALVGGWLARALLAAAGITVPAGPGPAGPGPTWLAALAVLGLCTAVMLWPAIRPAPPGAVRARRGRPAAVAGVLRSGADLAVAALAIVAVWQLRAVSAAAGGTGAVGRDPVLAAAPALALAGCALLLLRLIPLLAKGSERLSERGRSLGAALASWQISRRAVRQSAPVLLVLLAVAAGTLALSQQRSWRASAADQAAFAVGADIRLDTPVPVALASAGSVAQAPGVRAAVPVTAAGTAPAGQVLALDARDAARTVLLRPDQAALRPAALWQRLAPAGRPAGISLPGRPARLQIIASLSARAARSAKLGPVTARVLVQDASGAAYAAPAGRLPADGRGRALVALLSGDRRADYPLRLIGITVSYPLPPPSGAAAGRAAAAAGRGVLTVRSLAVSGAATGGFTAPFARGEALRGWLPRAASPELGTIAGAHGSAPSPAAWRPGPGGSRQLVFREGYGELTVKSGLPPQPVHGQLAVAVPGPSLPLPAIATRAFARASKAGRGSTALVISPGATFQARIVATVDALPGTGAGPALILDEGALQQLLAARSADPLPVSQWLLRSPAAAVPHALPPGSTVTVRARVAAGLTADPLAASPQQALLAVAGAVALLAAAGFGVSVAASVRERRVQHALLAALGVSQRGQARALCLELLLLSVPAAAAGLVAGAGLARLLVPAVTLTPAGTVPVPPPLVQLPLGWAAALALAVAALPVAATAATIARRPDPAAQLRSAEAG
jgi:FtsX-like permease family